MQKQISPAWKDLCAKIYSEYQIYHQAAGHEQKARNPGGGELKPRSDLIAAFLSSAMKLPSRGSALDIGCGNGAFLRAMDRLLPTWSITGADLDNTHRSQVESIGENASFRTIEELSADDHTYDVVSFIHCIEHIPEPTHYLSAARKHINDSGVLLIEVPDAELNPFDLVVADHASHFSKPVLAAIVEAAGYEVLTCGNFVISKEITLLARPRDNKFQRTQHKPSPAYATSITIRNLAWLEAALQRGEQLAQEPRPLGVFGTSIAAVWIGTAIGDNLDFYTDEDENRIGRDYFGVPIIAPDKIPLDATIFICLEPTLAASIAARHNAPRRHLIVPPPLLTLT